MKYRPTHGRECLTLGYVCVRLAVESRLIVEVRNHHADYHAPDLRPERNSGDTTPEVQDRSVILDDQEILEGDAAHGRYGALVRFLGSHRRCHENPDSGSARSLIGKLLVTDESGNNVLPDL